MPAQALGKAASMFRAALLRPTLSFAYSTTLADARKHGTTSDEYMAPSLAFKELYEGKFAGVLHSVLQRGRKTLPGAVVGAYEWPV
jgi:hypothetical protein